MLIERIDVGDRGRRIVEGWMEAGQTLGRLLRPLAIDGGRAYAYVPAPGSAFHDHNLLHGGLIAASTSAGSMMAKENLDAALARLTFLHLSAAPDRCALFENLLASATDPYLSRTPVVPFTVGDEVYFEVGPGPVREADVKVALDEASTASGYLGCWSRLEEADQQLSGERRLEAIATNSEAIVCTAFDGEGFIIWSSTGELPVRLEV